MKSKRVTYCALYAVAAIAIGLIESALPPLIPLAGVKLGLSNSVILFALVALPIGDAALVSLARSLVVAAASGNLFALAYSLPASACAFAVMAAGTRPLIGKISLPSTSAFGAVTHISVQVLAASLITGVSLAAYLPLAAAVSGVCGAATGAVAAIAIKKLPAALIIPDEERRKD